MYLSKIYSNYSLNFDFAHNYMAILEYIIIFLYKPLTYNTSCTVHLHKQNSLKSSKERFQRVCFTINQFYHIKHNITDFQNPLQTERLVSQNRQSQERRC